LHAAGLGGKNGSELRGVDREGAIVVQINAETARLVMPLLPVIEEVSAARRRTALRVRSRRLRAGHHQAVEIYGELGIDVLDDGVVGGDELIDGVGSFGNVGSDVRVTGEPGAWLLRLRVTPLITLETVLVEVLMGTPSTVSEELSPATA